MTEQLNNEPLQLAGGGLIYRLSAPANTGGYNVDEINVTMWGGSRSPEARAEGAQRVMACVVACAGVQLEWLEGGTEGCVQGLREDRDTWQQHHRAVADQCDETEKQRDILLAALLQFKRADNAEQLIAAMDNANAVIAAVEQKSGGSAC